MKEIGVVKKELKGNKAKVAIMRYAACGDCHACEVSSDKKEMMAEARNDVGARPGDNVVVEMEFANLMRAAGIAYGMPLIAFFIGCFGGYFLGPSMGWDPVFSGFISGIVLTAVAYLIIRVFDRKGAFGGKRYEPVITEIMTQEELDKLVAVPKDRMKAF